jgi:transcriptional regulator with XRE-family HTH domain
MDFADDPAVAPDISRNLKARRLARGWTLDQFAAASQVSRAMISKIERGEVSPTAATLARLAAGLGVSLASLFGDGAASGRTSEALSPLSRADGQRVWRDPQTGYLRRNVSPPIAEGPAPGAAEIVDVTFPPGESVLFDNVLGWHGIAQQVWMLEGCMDISVGDEATRLEAGDCLFMRVDRPIRFHNPGAAPARYAVILSRKA